MKILSNSLTNYQSVARDWLFKCFGGASSQAEPVERAYRFMEEAIELAQSLDLPREDVAELIDYVYDRPKGEPAQEVGGVMVTLATLCAVRGVSLSDAAITELERVYKPEVVEKVRAKNAAKQNNSPLPGVVTDNAAGTVKVEHI